MITLTFFLTIFATDAISDFDSKQLPEGIAQSEWQDIKSQIRKSNSSAEGLKGSMITPSLAQNSYIKASNTDPFDSFGSSLAISGDTLVVGATGERSDATGVNGDQNNNDTGSAGAAYVFVRENGTWVQQAYLKASNTTFGGFNARFGTSVAISGDTIVVGAIAERSNATGVNGDQEDFSLLDAGAAYVFVRNGTTWTQQAYLKASNTDGGDFFGSSVSISGDTIVVGALGESSAATGINGDQADDTANIAGAVYVFVRSNDVWAQQAYIKASNTDANDLFGFSVSIVGDYMAVGAPNENSDATGINGDESSNTANDAGAVYVFKRIGEIWNQQAYIKASNTDAGDIFGVSMDMTENQLLVSASREDSNAIGVDGDQMNNSATNSGAAYLFSRTGDVWEQQAYFKASNTENSDIFGVTVAISDGTLLIGAHLERSNATGIDGDQADNSTERAGAAYIFTQTDTTWEQLNYLKASNTNEDDLFGFAIEISEGTAIISAVNEQSNATGVDGNQADNSADNSGAMYVYDFLYQLGGSVSGLDSGNSVILQNNAGDDINVDQNGAFTFQTILTAYANYDVTVSLQPSNPDQFCVVENGTGIMGAAAVSDVMVTCNYTPLIGSDFYSTGEDITLSALDPDGTTTSNPNDNGVLINDSDQEMDALFVVSPGTFNVGGIGGSININADGTFIYTPPADAFGNATFDYQVSDGFSVVDTQLGISVFSINDAPSFSLAGDVEVELATTQNMLTFPGFITDFTLGPNNESKQSILDYQITIDSDSNGILNGVDIDNSGTLSIDFTNNVGVALVDVSLQDDGGTDFGGMDTSPNQSFFIAMNNDLIFLDGFDGGLNSLILNHLAKTQTINYGFDVPTYYSETDTIEFHGEVFYIYDQHRSLSKREALENWLEEVLIFHAPYDDYDQDGIPNFLDISPMY